MGIAKGKENGGVHQRKSAEGGRLSFLEYGVAKTRDEAHLVSPGSLWGGTSPGRGSNKVLV